MRRKRTGGEVHTGWEPGHTLADLIAKYRIFNIVKDVTSTFASASRKSFTV